MINRYLITSFILFISFLLLSIFISKSSFNEDHPLIILDKYVNFRVGRNHRISSDSKEPSIESGKIFDKGGKK